MEIKSNYTQERQLTEYDITFVGGHTMTISLCTDDGDTVDFETYAGHAICFNITAKKGLSTADELELPAEEITLYTSHILAIQKRIRILPAITAEQKAAWDLQVKQFSKTIQ